jgi:integrase/recombinase XerD
MKANLEQRSGKALLLTESIEAFKKYMETMDRSKETIRGYSMEMAVFNRFLEKKNNGPVYLTEVNEQDMEDYLLHLKIKGDAPASRSRSLYILRSFYNFCYKKDLVLKNLGVKLEPIKVPQKERCYLTEEEVNELLTAIDNPIIHVVVQTLFMTGMRISEALNLTLQDVDMEKKVILVREGKGKKSRIIPISKKLHFHLVNYLSNVRPKVENNRFFATKKTGSLSDQHVNGIIRGATEKLGWNKNVTCHILRHSFASNLIKHDVNLVKVQKLLGHSSLKTTSIYTHSNLEELAKAVNIL